MELNGAVDQSIEGKETLAENTNVEVSKARTPNSGDAASSKEALASNIKLGMRFPNHQVLNQSDARPWHFQQKLRSDGRFRIIVFAADITNLEQMSRVNRLGEELQTSLLPRYTPKGAKIDSVIDVLTLHAGDRTKIELLDLHEVYHPFDKQTGWDYDKVYVDAPSHHEGDGKAYEGYGIDPKGKGVLVVARPDQYIGWIGELEDLDEIRKYFDGVLVSQR